VTLTPAPCQRRGKRRLESDGVINGYCAVVDPAAAGQAFEVTVSVEVIVNDQMPSEKIEAQIVEPHEIVEKRRVFGAPGHLLRVLVEDANAYDRSSPRACCGCPASAARSPTKR
jgi:Lrp/AsnC family leucine-responsive transcriptional regulator